MDTYSLKSTVPQPQCHLVRVRRRRGQSGYYLDPVTGCRHSTPSAYALRRLVLPYAIARDQLGWELLLNKFYEPMWCRMTAGGPAQRVIPGYVEHISCIQHLYSGPTPEAECVAIGRRTLAEWGIEVPANLNAWVAR